MTTCTVRTFRQLQIHRKKLGLVDTWRFTPLAAKGDFRAKQNVLLPQAHGRPDTTSVVGWALKSNICLSVYLYIYLPTNLPTYLCTYDLCTYLPTNLPTILSIYPIYLSM